MNRKKGRIQSDRKSLLEEEIVYSGNQHQETNISLVQFNESLFELSQVEDYSKLTACLRKDCYNWIIVSGLSDTKKMAEIFTSLELHRVDMKGILEVDDHSTITEYSNKIVFRANGLRFSNEGELYQDQESFILTDNYLVSFIEGGVNRFEEVIYAIKNSKVNLRTRGCDYLFVILLDKIISEYRTVIDKVEHSLESYTELVINVHEKETFLVEMLNDRKAYLKLKHIVYSLKDSVTKLLRSPNEIISKIAQVYLEDIQQQLQSISQDIETCDQAFNSIANLHFNNNNQKMNDIMKRLTVISTIFLPMTFFVGLWGMNFKNMPETQWEYGYFIAWAIIFVTAIMSWLYLKRKNWL